MKDYIYIGETPGDEPCEPGGGCEIKQQAECKAYIAQLRRMFGPEPEGAKLEVKINNHDLGSYRSVICWYDSEVLRSFRYAMKVEGNKPMNWDKKAIIDLAGVL